MKIIHTSDLHLGHSLYGYDRTDEQLSMLRSIESAISLHRPDVLVISGDIYHTAQPSAAVQRMFSDSINRIRAVVPGIVIVMIAGNHDSPSRHEVFRTPWRELNVHAIGIPDFENPDSHVVQLPGKGFIIAVPYIYSRNLPDGFFKSLLEHVARLNSNHLPVVVAAHTAVAGCDYTGHDNSSEMTIGGIDAIRLDEIGDGYDYLALGHIHCPQTLRGSHGKARYCGSPIAVSFDESYPHSVTLVEIDHHGSRPEVTTVEIESPHPLVTVPAGGPLEWNEVKPMLESVPSDRSCYIRLSVLVDSFLTSDIRDEAMRLCRQAGHRFCLIQSERKTKSSDDARTLSVSEFRRLKPREILEMYAGAEGVVLSDDMVSAFIEATGSLNLNN